MINKIFIIYFMYIDTENQIYNVLTELKFTTLKNP